MERKMNEEKRIKLYQIDASKKRGRMMSNQKWQWKTMFSTFTYSVLLKLVVIMIGHAFQK